MYDSQIGRKPEISVQAGLEMLPARGVRSQVSNQVPQATSMFPLYPKAARSCTKRTANSLFFNFSTSISVKLTVMVVYPVTIGDAQLAGEIR